MSDIKKININFEPDKDKDKQSKKRNIANTITWMEFENKFSKEEQMVYLTDIYEKKENHKDIHGIIEKEISKKMSGYKNQDKLKKLYNEEKFITKDEIIKLMYDCSLNCYYCKEQTNLLYDTVRDNKQWSLERLENEFGHNSGNVVISCLKCNLSRKTMYHERYLFTKQIGNIKKV